MSDQFRSVVRQLTPEIYENMRRAVELGRWPDGRTVSPQQRETCMQAIIAWEAEHVPEEQRTGYMPSADCESDAQSEAEQPVTIRSSATGRKDNARSDSSDVAAGIKGDDQDA
ncbi:MAG: DUF1315 family protein [Gammaproteobacteria bacterium]|jgi:uncharacterized protein YeaC (DUF1315 family)|nr:DUF1315 family protein [Gammaproteobacteria bacterium]MBQ0773750.1 DUF1315 family protein [Gammaproteobacteria bacterium]|tara:strand:+ start:47864 stop:48202 length:339 start_codon:yes stop_codon:yes gene_type:complete